MIPHLTLDVELPSFLECEAYGDVRLTGHRILLVHVVRRYREGFSPEMLWEEFPSLSLSHIHKVIAFYLDHREAVDQYLAANDAEVDRQVAEADAAAEKRGGRLTLDVLRQRLEAKRKAEALYPGG